jgi:hypothetical protein
MVTSGSAFLHRSIVHVRFIMLTLGLSVFGFRFHSTFAESVATVAVAVPLGFAMNWAFTTSIW